MNENLTEMHADSSSLRDGSNPTTPKVSVIVPVYKVEKYLPECIESILAQTFTDFELILVDDGSPDNSGKICDDYAARDSRIRVFHKENGGVSSARNLGLDNARGEWVTFVDSDDWLESPGTLHHLSGSLTSDVDILFFGYSIHNHCKSPPRRTFIPRMGTRRTRAETYTSLYLGGFINSPCAKVFRRTPFCDAIRYPEGIGLSEDTIFVTKCFSFNPKIETLSLLGYGVRRGHTSAISRYNSNFFYIYRLFFQTLLENTEIKPDSAEYAKISANRFWFVPFEVAKPQCDLSLKEKLSAIKEAMEFVPRGKLPAGVRGKILKMRNAPMAYFYAKSICVVSALKNQLMSLYSKKH